MMNFFILLFVYFLVPYWVLNATVVATALVNLALLLVPPRGGILAEPALSGGLLALSTPFLINVALKLRAPFDRVAWGIAVLAIVAAVSTVGATPLIMLAAMFFAALSYVRARTSIPLGLIFLGLFGAFSYPFLGVLSATLPATSSFFFSRSDWGRILFETGWVGLFASLFAYGFVLFRARAYPLLFCATVGWFWFALTNTPTKYFLPSMVMTVVLQRLYLPFSSRFFQGTPPQTEM